MRQFLCDWCGARFEDRSEVAHLDVTIGSRAESLHSCVRCAPDFLRSEFSEDAKPIDAENADVWGGADG